MLLIVWIVGILTAAGTTLCLPPNGRVLGGKVASSGQFPFIVHLNSDCGGAIINRNWVLTAAHCLNYIPDNPRILAGTNKLHSGGIKYNITQHIPHEDYEPFTGWGAKDDIALIQIEGEFEFSDLIQPVECIDPEENSTCFFAGWGETESDCDSEELLFVELTALNYQVCREVAGDELGESYLGPEQVCALGPKGKGACFGDSGGPLVCNGKLGGVVSYTIVACAEGYPDVYTKPAKYVDWINEKI